MYGYTNVAFTTTIANEDILQINEVKNAIKDRMAINTDEDYQIMLSSGMIRLEFDLYFNGSNTVSINNGYASCLLEDTIYSSGEKVTLKSIKIGNIASGVFSFIA